MAILASRRKSQRQVVGLGILVLRLVAGVAVHRQPGKLPHSRALVACVALDRCMRPYQWEAVLVLLNLVHRYLPAAYGMALFASRPELAAMQIGMTIRAALPHVCKHQAGVALHAGNVYVHSAKGIGGLVVIKVRY